MSTNAIRGTLESRVAAFAAAQSPALRVAYENVAFTPANGETYLRANMVPAATLSADLAGAHRGYIGIFQVTVVRPKGQGAGPALALAAALDAYFPVNGRYGTNPVVQIVRPASAAPAIVEDDTYNLPVSIWYRADTI